MELVKVKLNEAVAGANESYPDKSIQEVSKDQAERWVEQGTASYVLESDEVLEYKEEIDNLKKVTKKMDELKAEIVKLKKENAKLKK